MRISLKDDWNDLCKFWHDIYIVKVKVINDEFFSLWQQKQIAAIKAWELFHKNNPTERMKDWTLIKCKAI